MIVAAIAIANKRELRALKTLVRKRKKNLRLERTEDNFDYFETANHDLQKLGFSLFYAKVRVFEILLRTILIRG